MTMTADAPATARKLPPKPAEIQLAKANRLKDLFSRSATQLKEVSAKHLDPERQIRLAMICMNKTPKLLDCDPMTILSSVITASQLGLELGGPLAEAHLVPFRDECQLIVGYQGLQALATRSGKVLDIESEAVYSEDYFEYERGLTPKLIHRPNFDTDNRGELRLVWAIATLPGGIKHVEVVPRADIDRIADQVRARSHGRETPWDTAFEAMARKTGIRRICKYIPKNAELRTALEHNDAVEFGTKVDLVDGDVVERTAGTKAARLAEHLKSQRQIAEADGAVADTDAHEPHHEEPSTDVGTPAAATGAASATTTATDQTPADEYPDPWPRDLIIGWLLEHKPADMTPEAAKERAEYIVNRKAVGMQTKPWELLQQQTRINAFIKWRGGAIPWT